MDGWNDVTWDVAWKVGLLLAVGLSGCQHAVGEVEDGGGSSSTANPGAATGGPQGSGCTMADGGLGVWNRCGQCTDRSLPPSLCTVTECAAGSEGDQCGPGGQGICCGSGCVDLSVDAFNCGSCGLVCPTGSSCIEGACELPDGGAPCAAGSSASCPDGSVCYWLGACGPASCDGEPDGQRCALPSESGSGVYGEVSGACCAGSCVDVTTASNCGRCGVHCASGQCVTPDGDVTANGYGASQCLPAPSDAGCGPAGCPTGESCVDGLCLSPSCDLPTPFCDDQGTLGLCEGWPPTCQPIGADGGSEAANSSSAATGGPQGSGCTMANGGLGIRNLCGQCTDQGWTTCTVTECPAGADGDQCGPDGQGMCCGGGCVDLSIDGLNCGICGFTCPTGSSCIEGACELPDGGLPCTAGSSASCPQGSSCGWSGACAPASCEGEPDGQICTLQSANGGGYVPSECCAGSCVDLTTASNCGSCGVQCASGQCATPSYGSSLCLPVPSAAGCGPAGCPTGESCLEGVCVSPNCALGTPFCDDQGSLGLCEGWPMTCKPSNADAGSYPDSSCGSLLEGSGCTLQDGTTGVCTSCGSCVQLGQVLPASQSGLALQCPIGPVTSCAGAPEGDYCDGANVVGGSCCNGVCVDTGDDANNCGGCGDVCPAGAACDQESCVFADGGEATCAAAGPGSCPQGFQCLVAWGGAAVCLSSSCAGLPDGQSCAGPGSQYQGYDLMCCGGVCTDVSTDANNCGACGNECQFGACLEGEAPAGGGFINEIVCAPDPAASAANCSLDGGCPAGESCLGHYCATLECFADSPYASYCVTPDGGLGVCDWGGSCQRNGGS